MGGRFEKSPSNGFANREQSRIGDFTKFTCQGQRETGKPVCRWSWAHCSPFEMECERGMRAMVRNAGSATRVSAHSIWPTSLIIMDPMRMSTGAEAMMGTAPKRGEKKSEHAKRNAAVSAVRPVLPPSRIPAVHSTAMMIGEHPVQAATIVPTPEATRAQVPPGTDSPTFVMIPAFMERPTRQPGEERRRRRQELVSEHGREGRWRYSLSE